MTGMPAFNQAREPDIRQVRQLAATLHADQTDGSGQPYIGHVERVARNIRALAPFVQGRHISDDVVKAALLHDTIEDCETTANGLLELGYSQACVDMVQIVTKEKGFKRPYADVIDGIIASGNEGAMLIKLADNMDNLHPERATGYLPDNPGKEKALNARYRASVEKLSAALGIDHEDVRALIDTSPELATLITMDHLEGKVTVHERTQPNTSPASRTIKL